jgi:hypothetical protein
VPLVIVCAPLDLSSPHRQERLGAIESQYLALLVDAQHDRTRGRRQIEADDIVHLLDERRIG